MGEVTPGITEVVPTRCVALRVDGERCRAFATTGSDTCFAHGQGSMWREANSRGGSAARAAASEQRRADTQAALALGDVSKAGDYETAQGIKRLLGETLALLRAGTMDSGRANALATVSNSMRAYLELTDIEERLAKLERAIGGTNGFERR